MDTLDDSENHAKISDSAYSNSCSNSHSRRSRSSKSTNSSGSSGYGGKPQSAYCDISEPAEKRLKEADAKKKKQVQNENVTVIPEETTQVLPNQDVTDETITEEIENVVHMPLPPPVQSEKPSETTDISSPKCSSKDEARACNAPLFADPKDDAYRSGCSEGFSCVISMHDGVVMYTTMSLTAALGFPKDMWIGRSFIDFVHPRDSSTFASHITNGFPVPKNVNGTQEEAPPKQDSICTMVCRIRRYKSLATGFGVKGRPVNYVPFSLKLSFKNISDEEGEVIYLVIQATPFFSAFETPNETMPKTVPFVIRHAANGNFDYIDPESVPYLGYLPQDLADKDALQLYHPEDLPYIRQVYETIVKEGGAPRSKAYRLLAQNGDFLKVETEWSAFINPWSRKLECIIAKHHIVEGPSNPDVFQTYKPNKPKKVSEEEKNRIQSLRDSIIRVMTEVRTKPAEIVKQQMSKRCQDLANFMESLIDDQPKPEEELRLDMQDPENSCNERDSVMLGGISPHHDYNDSKSSAETALTYNQHNYNETLHRYFESHQPYSYEDYHTVNGENVLEPRGLRTDSGKLARMVRKAKEVAASEKSSAASGESTSGIIGDYTSVRLTESVINKHNAEMEKEFMKTRRETRSSSRGERVKAVVHKKQKKEHLARCNAAFQPTAVVDVVKATVHGVKRTSKMRMEPQPERESHKHHCSSKVRRRKSGSNAVAQPITTVTTTVATTQWPTNTTNTVNTFILGMGMPQPVMSPMVAMSGMYPMYYAPHNLNMPSTSAGNTPMTGMPYFPQPMQCKMYGQTMYGTPVMYAPMDPSMMFQQQQNMLPRPTTENPINIPLGLANSHYEEVCKQRVPYDRKLHAHKVWKQKKRSIANAQNSGDSSSSAALNQDFCSSDSETHDSSMMSSAFNVSSTFSFRPKSSDANLETALSSMGKEHTDGEDSYSSFYSSFFKTESGSAEDSDAKKAAEHEKKQPTKKFYEPPVIKKLAKRKMDPPWLEQVSMTSELIYKYQIQTKSLEEVLKADKEKMTTLDQQPPLVNEQLEQLYLDLQLQGVASRLTLEEGVSSSSSSEDEASTSTTTRVRHSRKREYCQLSMVYEEDAPLPPAEDLCVPSTSKTQTITLPG